MANRQIDRLADDNTGTGRWTLQTPLRRLAFFVFWLIVLELAVDSRGAVPRGQAFVRTATLPLVVGALAIVFERFPVERLTLRHVATVAAVTLPTIHVAYVLGAARVVEVALIVVLASVLAVRSAEVVPKSVERTLVTTLLALMVSECIFQYVNYQVRRIGEIPASVMLLALRTASSALGLFALRTAAIVARRASNRLSDARLCSIALHASCAIPS